MHNVLTSYYDLDLWLKCFSKLKTLYSFFAVKTFENEETNSKQFQMGFWLKLIELNNLQSLKYNEQHK